MDKRTLIIVAALATPVLSLAVLAKFSATSRNNIAGGVASSRPDTQRPLTKTEQTVKIRQRLAQIMKMTTPEWEEFKKTHPGAAPTQAEAIANNKKRLDELSKDMAQGPDADGQWALRQIQSNPPPAQPAGQRLPELSPKAAAPVSAAAPTAPDQQ